jgi:hypothetical protein
MGKSILASNEPRRPVIPDEDWLSLGNTMLNLAVTNGERANGGLAKGMFLWYVGQSGSAKTQHALRILAEASINKHFDDHRFVFDNIENGNYFDMAKMWPKLAKRIEPANPKGPSRTVQELYYNIDNALNKGPCIYIPDSMDALLTEQGEEHFEKSKDLFEQGKEGKGRYGADKAKANSENISRVVNQLPHNGSCLLMISQIRQNISGYGPSETASGGKALRFYAHVQLWAKVKSPLTRTVMGKEREYGKLVSVDIRKNRISSFEGELELPFLADHGFDDIGSMVDYLTEEKYWQKKSGRIEAEEFDHKGFREDLIQKIENVASDIKKTRMLCKKLWKEIRDKTRITRKNIYL